jgi:hypothetical protein
MQGSRDEKSGKMSGGAMAGKRNGPAKSAGPSKAEAD